MIGRLKTQAGRDLYWALQSPMLMDHESVADVGWGQREVDRYSGILSRLDEPGSPLWKATRRNSSAHLGEYFEILLTTWIKAVPPATHLASNWQVFGRKGTIGEYDLLFRRDGVVRHWELAVKFYLGHPDLYGKGRWYGPNPVDRLDRKWAKMRGQQLRLSHHPAGAGALRMLGIREPVESRAFIKGYFFEPLDEQFAVEMSLDANKAAPRGWWCHQVRWQAHRGRLARPGRMWLPLSRLRWLSPVVIEEGERLLSFDELEPRRFSEPTLLVGVEEGPRGFEEVTRGFVVPESWPHGVAAATLAG